jgi:hypothetical protein
MTTADFCNKQVDMNQSKLMISGEDPGTAAYVPGAQGGMPKISSKFIMSEKQSWRHVTYGTYNPIKVMHKTHGQSVQI